MLERGWNFEFQRLMNADSTMYFLSLQSKVEKHINVDQNFRFYFNSTLDSNVVTTMYYRLKNKVDKHFNVGNNFRFYTKST